METVPTNQTAATQPSKLAVHLKRRRPPLQPLIPPPLQLPPSPIHLFSAPQPLLSPPLLKNPISTSQSLSTVNLWNSTFQTNVSGSFDYQTTPNTHQVHKNVPSVNVHATAKAQKLLLCIIFVHRSVVHHNLADTLVLPTSASVSVTHKNPSSCQFLTHMHALIASTPNDALVAVTRLTPILKTCSDESDVPGMASSHGP